MSSLLGRCFFQSESSGRKSSFKFRLWKSGWCRSCAFLRCIATEKRRKRLERATLGQHGKNTIYVSQQGRMTTSHVHEVLPKKSMYLSGVAVPKFGIQRPSCTTFGACHLVFKCFPVIVNQTGGARYCN